MASRRSAAGYAAVPANAKFSGLLDERKLSQADAAKVLGVTQPKVSARVYTHIGTSAHLISSRSLANEETDVR